MAELRGVTPVAGMISPGKDDRNTWPTHKNDWGMGGLKFAADLAERDKIPVERRFGSVVLVWSNADGDKQAFRWTGTKEDGSDGQWQETELGTQDIPVGGIDIVQPDGSTVTGISLFALDGIELVGNSKDGFTLKVKGGGTSFKVGPNLELQPDGKGGNVLSIAPGTFELRKTPGYLAYVQYPEFLYGKAKEDTKYRKGAIWPDMLRVSPEGMLQIDRAGKALGLQETDGKDPNITGGSKFLVWPFVYLEGVAPDDGYVELLVVKKTEGSLAVDMDGHPLAVRHNYKQGEVLTPKHAPIMLAQVMQVKGLTEYQVVLVDSFDEYVKILDYSEGPSGLCVQELSKDGTVSEALLCAEVDTGFSVRVESYYLGTYLASIGYLTGIAEKAQVVKAGSRAHTVAGVEMYALSDLEFAVTQGMIQVKSSGLAVTDFYIGLELSPEQGRMIAGKDLVANLALEDKDSGWDVGFFSYTGDVSKRPPIYGRRNNGSLVLNKGWTQWHTGFISEDVVSGIHSEAFTGTVPKDADYLMVALYPVVEQNPMTLNLRGFHLDAANPEEVFSVNEIKISGLQHLDFMQETVKLVQDTQGFASLRYTLNDVAEGLPLPMGVPQSALKYLTLDKSLNVVGGSSARGGEGALVASERVEITIWQQWQLYNEQAVGHEAQMWLVVYRDGTGSTEEVPNSRTTFTVDSKRPGVDYFTTNKVTFTLEPGDYFYMRGKADAADGAYAQTSQKSKPLLITYLEERYMG